jgi:type IV secretory pathway TrbL component
MKSINGETKRRGVSVAWSGAVATAAVGRRLAGLRRAKSVQGAGSSRWVAGRPGARTGAGTVAASHGRGARWIEREHGREGER